MFLFRFYVLILEFEAVHKPRKSCEFVEKSGFEKNSPDVNVGAELDTFLTPRGHFLRLN